MKRFAALALVFQLSHVACAKERDPGATVPATTSASASSSPTATAIASATPGAPIGSATMETDGTVVLMLRAEGTRGEVGDAMFRYPPGHKDYDQVLKHVGGLRPGESKPVPPWP